jgi:purine-binding chemotaxis protein CheW
MFRDGVERLLVFRVGPERFAVTLGAVDEVIDFPPVQPLPDASATLRGLATLRGELVSIYDPRPLLNVGGDAHGAVLLFERGGRRVGLAIDDVFDAIVVEEAELRTAPGRDASDGILVGVVRRGNDLVAVLDADALIDGFTTAAMSVREGERA